MNSQPRCFASKKPVQNKETGNIFSIYQAICQSFYLSICQSIYPFTYLYNFIYLSIYQFIYLSIHPPTWVGLAALGEEHVVSAAEADDVEEDAGRQRVEQDVDRLDLLIN